MQNADKLNKAVMHADLERCELISVDEESI